ncbi:MAG: OprO/OprP family phosphate-selective porin [Dysgonamonadaceae bacterium]|jgi:hypothetical protein|nr:OprO/OprP family phosphate-selective porin [Dysgonamonadaceae bacterium]
MKIKLQVIALSLICLVSTGLKAQEVELTETEKLAQRTTSLENAVKKLQKFKVSGYIQTQYQWAEVDADGINFKLPNRANAYEQAEQESFSRFGVRRGRIKFTYEDGLFSGVFQPDFTERGVSFKDVYLNVRDPWTGTNALRAGIFDRPFGHEVAYSSSRRESPERARIIQTLFPDERDLGAMLVLQPAKTSPWNILKLEAGLFAGNGIRPEIDSRMDFIGHLSVTKTIKKDMVISGGVSAYLGGVFQGTDNVYVMENNIWKLDVTDGYGKFAQRNYFGVDAQFSTTTCAGLTQLRGEYIFGKNPGNIDGAYDFKLTALPAGDTYMRNISGGYVILTQELGKLPLTFVAKYDWYDPNTNIAGNNITNKGEILMSNIGLGLFWDIDSALRLTAYYDIVKNETSENVTGWKEDRKDNVFTLRLQYKF